VDRLRAELAAVGVRRARANRIAAEVDDHLACDPTAVDRLGDPRVLAQRFADELASVGACRAALTAFMALAAIASAYAAPLLALDAAGGYPDLFGGHSAALGLPAAILMLVAPQVAFVAGVLAFARAVRLRGDSVLPAAEIRLLERPGLVGLGAGALAVGAVALYAGNFAAELPAWWTALALGASGVGLAVASLAAVRFAPIVALRPATEGRPGDLADDLPFEPVRRLTRRPWLLCAVAAAAVAAVALLSGWQAEGTVGEGALRAAFETAALVAGFAALGRFLGIRR
jgi:hypothetical protein